MWLSTDGLEGLCNDRGHRVLITIRLPSCLKAFSVVLSSTIIEFHQAFWLDLRGTFSSGARCNLWISVTANIASAVGWISLHWVLVDVTDVRCHVAPVAQKAMPTVVFPLDIATSGRRFVICIKFFGFMDM